MQKGSNGYLAKIWGIGERKFKNNWKKMKLYNMLINGIVIMKQRYGDGNCRKKLKYERKIYEVELENKQTDTSIYVYDRH